MKREDPLEERLRRLEWRPLPESWREEILVAAEDDRRPAAGRAGLLQRVKPLLNELLWPSPRAWAGLAAVWVALLAANRIFAPPQETASAKSWRPPTDMKTALEARRKLWEELGGWEGKRQVAQRESRNPGPQSRTRDQTLNA